MEIHCFNVSMHTWFLNDLALYEVAFRLQQGYAPYHKLISS